MRYCKSQAASSAFDEKRMARGSMSDLKMLTQARSSPKGKVKRVQQVIRGKSNDQMNSLASKKQSVQSASMSKSTTPFAIAEDAERNSITQCVGI